MAAQVAYRVTKTEVVEVIVDDGDNADALAKAERVFLNPTPKHHGFIHSQPKVVNISIDRVS